MTIKRYVAYYRVSTGKQATSGLGLEAQRKTVIDFLNSDSRTLLAEFTEVVSGKCDKRAQLTCAMNLCRTHGATLVIAALDRLSRKVSYISTLMESKIPFVDASRPNATNFELHIRAVIAEEETRAVSIRTKNALAAAKARGVKLGNPAGFRGQVYRNGDAAVERADAFAKSVSPIITALRKRGFSLREIAARLSRDGVETARGGQWTATSVKNTLQRVKYHDERTRSP